jgi:hypothetical protein
MLAVARCSLCYVEYFGRQKNILRTCTNKSTRNAQIVLALSPCHLALQYLGFVPPPSSSSSAISTAYVHLAFEANSLLSFQ